MPASWPEQAETHRIRALECAQTAADLATEARQSGGERRRELVALCDGELIVDRERVFTKNSNPLILDFTRDISPSWFHFAIVTIADPQVSLTGLSVSRDSKVQNVVTICRSDIRRDLLASVVPITVPIKIDPRIDNSRRITRSLDTNRDFANG